MANEEVKRSGLLIVFSGPAGSGKGTVLGKLFEMRSDCVNSVSATTRAPRPGEIDGVNYHFISEETFNNWISQDLFIEWDHHFKAYYGTPRQFVEENLKNGKNVILEIDDNGGLEVMKKEPGCVSIFLSPPSWEVLEARLRGRGTETDEQITSRMLKAKTEIKHMKDYQYIVVNDTVEAAAARINAIIEAELSKTRRVLLDKVVDFDVL